MVNIVNKFFSLDSDTNNENARTLPLAEEFKGPPKAIPIFFSTYFFLQFLPFFSFSLYM